MAGSDTGRKRFTMADASIKEVMAYFGIPIATFSKEWKELSDSDKADLRRGIGDGTLTY